MTVDVRKYEEKDLPAMMEIWNGIVEKGEAFPQEQPLTLEQAREFFQGQSFTGVAEGDGQVVGLYILHPNNVGRCGHISNASYGVDEAVRGGGIGRALVEHSLKMGKELGFGLLQFNAVVSTNESAIHLYEQLGFVKIGRVPGGFRKKDGTFEDILLFYHVL